MRKGKILIIISAALVLSLTGYFGFIFVLDQIEKRDVGTASAMANETKDKSGNYTYIPPTYEYDDNNSNGGNSMTDVWPTSADWTPATEMDLDPTSITVFVNKEYTLSKDYVPSDLVEVNVPFELEGYDERKMLRSEAATALEQLFRAAQADGYTLYGVSGYRSYDRQKQIFLENIVKKGKTHTLKYSAIPGTSEHQTGLSIDISCKSIHYDLTDEFASSPEGKWVAENAHYYGFIIRYPKDRAKITGYEYEPWHVRYVGKDLANYLFYNDMTLDEYYKYTPSKDFNYEEKYADLINFVPTATPAPTVTPVPSITPTPTPAPTTTPEPTDGKKDDSQKDSGSANGNTDTKGTDNTDTKSGTDTGSNSGTNDISPTPAPTKTPESGTGQNTSGDKTGDTNSSATASVTTGSESDLSE